MTLDHLKKILTDYCATRPEIAACYLYGSYAAGKERPDSDVDLAFLLDSSVIPDDYAQLQLTYITELGSLSKQEIHPLIMNNAGELVLGQVFTKGSLVYQRNQEQLKAFKRHKLPLVADFSYYLSQRLGDIRHRYGGAARG